GGGGPRLPRACPQRGAFGGIPAAPAREGGRCGAAGRTPGRLCRRLSALAGSGGSASRRGEVGLMSNDSTYYRRHGKRALDLLVSAGALVVLAPVLLVLAGLVWCFLGRPILFCQCRSGRGQRPFTIYKFRTMTNECASGGELLPETRRLTRFGRFLRSTSLDELPELVNVLKGEMSLVGPRPLLPEYDAYYSAVELRRF